MASGPTPCGGSQSKVIVLFEYAKYSIDTPKPEGVIGTTYTNILKEVPIAN